MIISNIPWTMQLDGTITHIRDEQGNIIGSFLDIRNAERVIEIINFGKDIDGLTEMEDEIHDKDNEIHELEENVSRLQDKIDSQYEDKEELKDRVKELEEENNDLRNEITELRSRE